MGNPMYMPGQAVRDGTTEGVVVKTSATSVKVWFPGWGTVDYQKSCHELTTTGTKTADCLEQASSAMELATLLLQLFLSKKGFSIQEGTITVLEDEKMLQLPAKTMGEAIEAIKILL